MWSEVDGGGDAHQIGTCLSKHLNTNDPQVAHVTLYSDTCGGQNKNTHLVEMFMAVLKNHPILKIIDHKILLAGHTRMECDSDHAPIEKNKKQSNVSIYHPHDWLQLVRQTGKKKTFRVI